MDIQNLLPQAEVDQIRDAVHDAHNILVISHKSPDGDAIGSALGLVHALRNIGKNAVPCCYDPTPQSFNYLEGVENYISDFNPDEYDLIIAVDCGAHYLMKFHETKPELLTDKYTIINIDHHPSNDYFGKINLVIDKAAAAALIIYFLFQRLNYTITPTIATALLTGLYTDTGSFMHSNTTPEVYRVAGELIALGADFQRIAKENFNTTPVKQLKLWGRVLEKTQLNEKNITTAAATQNDFNLCKAEPSDLTGVIDYLNTIPESKLCILLAEHNNGTIKGSMRTQNDRIDLAKIAGLFGGGGHSKAAGFTIDGSITPKTVWSINDH